nr:hypothetical protein CFP56_41052 [Quercus suber]
MKVLRLGKVKVLRAQSFLFCQPLQCRYPQSPAEITTILRSFWGSNRRHLLRPQPRVSHSKKAPSFSQPNQPPLFWVWSGWRSVVGVVIFVGEGWVFLGGFDAVDGELMVDLGLLTADLVLLMADLELIGGVLFDEVLGWRFDDFSGLVFSCWFGFDEFFMF